LVGFQADHDGFGGITVIRGIGARSAVKRVGAAAALDLVVAAEPEDRVVAAVTEDRVGAIGDTVRRIEGLGVVVSVYVGHGIDPLSEPFIAPTPTAGRFH
jgi:hypothetical protein